MNAALPSTLSGVLFDLDGTLVDSAPGITACLAETIAAFGGDPVTASELRHLVGPPVADSIRDYTGQDAAGVAAAIADYRSRYLERGIANSVVFPGVQSLLVGLREHGVPLAVATSKRESHARALLAHHHLDGAFDAIAGAAEDDSGADKRDIIEAALARIGVAADTAVMIGDRRYDIEGATAAGVASIFAVWGYGAEAEAHGAAQRAQSPLDASYLLTDHLNRITR